MSVSTRKTLVVGATLIIAGTLAWGAAYVWLFPKAAPIVLPVIMEEDDAEECRARVPVSAQRY